MRRLILLALLALACRTAAPLPPSTPPIPSHTPPPLPERNINAARVSGRIVDSIGRGVDGARVVAWASERDCVPAGPSLVTHASASGEFALTLERGVGPEQLGCVVIEATAGGSSARAERTVVYTSSETDSRSRVELELSLPRAPAVSRAEGERLVRLLADAIGTGEEATLEELDLYIWGDRDRVRAALDAYRQYLRGVSAIELTGSEENAIVQWQRWRMTGVAGREVTTAVYRENLIELHGPLIDFGDRAAGFVERILDFAHHGDPERMARLLTADDVDTPVETAQRVIDFLRARFDLPRATVVLAGVDESGHTLRYRVSGPSREGALMQEILEVGYGDGLVWLRGF